MINKVVLRSLKKNWKLFSSIFFLITLASIIISISDLSYTNISKSNEVFKENSNREDLSIYYSDEFFQEAKNAIKDVEKNIV